MRGVGGEHLVRLRHCFGRLLEFLVFLRAHRFADPIGRATGRDGKADLEQRLADFRAEVITMPGLPKVPAADSIDVNADGKIVGLF